MRVVFFIVCNMLTVAPCPERCVCEESTLVCTRPDLPSEIPANISKVYISNFTLGNLKDGTFHNNNWKHVNFLDIHADKGDTLGSKVFTKLENLQYLGLHCDQLKYIYLACLEGIDKVHTLNLSNNYYLALSVISQAWDRSKRRVLPIMEDLILSKLYTYEVTPLKLEYDFFHAVSFDRKLKYLDISYTNIAVIDATELSLLCDYIVHIKAHGVSVANPKKFNSDIECKSLRTLDITDIDLPIAKVPIINRNIQFQSNLYTSIENLIASGILKFRLVLNSIHFDMSSFDFHFKKVIMKRNNMKWLNMTLTSPKNTTVLIAELDFSENGLEFLAPEILYPSRNLRILRLSKNNLNEMQFKQAGDFERLLLKSVNLQELHIAENRITTFPNHFFANNLNLEYIDMSGNKLESIEFDMSGLVKLLYLDLRKNWIRIIDRNMYLIFDQLDTLGQYTSQRNSTIVLMKTTHDDHNYQFQVNLGNNPFVCICGEEFYFSIKYMYNSKYIQRENTSYMCEFQGDYLDLFASAGENIQTKCAYQSLLNSLKISIPVVVITVIALVLVCILVRRCQRNKWNFQRFLAALRNDKFDKTFLAFLSHCSEDYDFVMAHIYPQLQQSLAELINIDKNFVCIGDREFRLGLRVHAELTRCMEESSVAVFVISKTFCKKDWCKMEVGEAVDQHKPIVIIMKEFVKTDEMPKVIRQIFNRYTRASWVHDDNGGHLEPDMNIISKSIIELAQRKAKTDAEDNHIEDTV